MYGLLYVFFNTQATLGNPLAINNQNRTNLYQHQGLVESNHLRGHQMLINELVQQNGMKKIANKQTGVNRIMKYYS